MYKKLCHGPNTYGREHMGYKLNLHTSNQDQPNTVLFNTSVTFSLFGRQCVVQMLAFSFFRHTTQFSASER